MRTRQKCVATDTWRSLGCRNNTTGTLEQKKTNSWTPVGLFKTEFKTESYLYCPMTRAHRRSYARFRCGVVPLRLETGRYEGLAESERVCFNCEGAVENVEHLLLVCPLFDDLRQTLLQTICGTSMGYSELCNEAKLKAIFSSVSFTVIRVVAKICHEILMRRQNNLYKT